MPEEVSTVFIVDDDRPICESIQMLARSAGFACETYRSAEAMLDGFCPAKAGCLVVDLRLPGMSGLELLDRLPSEPVKLPSVVLTGFGDVPSVVRATKAGAVGFIEKPFNPTTLLQHIHEAVQVNRRAREEHSRHQDIRRRIGSLTPRERQVLDMIVTGKANKDIAAILHRSQKTVEVHRTHVMKKMRAGNVADLVRLVVGDAGLGTLGSFARASENHRGTALQGRSCDTLASLPSERELRAPGAWGMPPTG